MFSGYGIFYANFLAHRDPDVFEKPEDFIPERWNGSNAGDEDKIFGFGSGPHRCIGENLMRDVMHFVGKVSSTIFRLILLFSVFFAVFFFER